MEKNMEHEKEAEVLHWFIEIVGRGFPLRFWVTVYRVPREYWWAIYYTRLPLERP